MTEQKSWGWEFGRDSGGSNRWTKKGGSSTLGEVPKVTYEFSITDPATIKKVSSRLRSYGAMLGAYVTSVALPIPTPQIGPTLLMDTVMGIIDLMMTTNATYTRGIEVGDAVSLPTGLGAALVGVGAEIAATISAERALGYTEATGVVKHGHIYELSRYDRSLFPSPAFGDLTDEFVEIGRLAINGVVALVGAAIDQVVGALVSPGTTSTPRSNRTAQMEISGDGETPFVPSIGSWVWEAGSNPTGYRVQRPIDFRGPVDVGHYGVGGFHQFMPRNRILVNPATLTFFYEDSELGVMDENELSIYRWNVDREDWDFVGGTRDPGANTVTATVNELALYTMAPPLPAGHITLTTEWAPGGTELEPTTTETYTTDTLRLNTGAVVPDGTLYTVAGSEPADAFIPYGTVLTPDADPTTVGTQVAAVGGTLQFTVVYPAASGGVRPMVFSRVGTALAATLTYLRPE